ncbi:MAG: alpha/beta hydrolase [Saprospiraceae bacterium]
MAASPSLLKRWRWLFITIGILLIVIILLFQPWGIAGLKSNPQPVQSYVEAVQRIQANIIKDSATLNPLCQTVLLSQGRKVERVIVMVHGYTSCPHQFFTLGQQFYELGYNVLIAPMPYHGYKDRLTEAHANLTAEDLARYADEVVDIAQGLGEKVTMMGLSVGGVVTAWAAQHRTDMELAVLISPAFGYGPIPPPTTAAVMNVFRLMPNGYEWWNPEKQAQGGVPHGYPRYAKRALAEALRLGFSVQQSAKKLKPSTPLLVITNANDHQINNERTAAIVALWRKNGAQLETYEFSENLQLVHDLIEPFYQKEKVEKLVYPRLLEMTSKINPDSLTKVYKLITKTEQADINYEAIQNLDDPENEYFAQKEKAFSPVKGKFTVYLFKASFPGFSFKGDGYYIFHDVLLIKTDANNNIVDALQYTLEWTEELSADLYRSTAKNVKLTDSLDIRLLQLTRDYDTESDESNLLEENGILQFNK